MRVFFRQCGFLFIENSFFFCIVKIARRDDDSVQESLGALLLKVVPVLGTFMTDSDIKVC